MSYHSFGIKLRCSEVGIPRNGLSRLRSLFAGIHDQLLDGRAHMSSPAHVNFEIEAVTPGRRSMHWEVLNPLPGISCSSELLGIGVGRHLLVTATPCMHQVHDGCADLSLTSTLWQCT